MSSVRALWLILRRVWPRWRDALVLVQPATVDHWHRDRFVRRWRRRSRRPGRPRIDSPCRDLIALLADENRLWGAPRIHGELLKLGVVVSERTVSRYLRERPKRPSQTLRTFLANHLAQFECNTDMLSTDVSSDDLVDASPCRPISSDRLPASRQCALVDRRRLSLGLPCTQDHLRDRTGMRRSAGRAPPRLDYFQCTHGGRGEGRLVQPDRANGNRDEGDTVGIVDRDQYIGTNVIRTLAVRLVCRSNVCVAAIADVRNIGEAQRSSP